MHIILIALFLFVFPLFAAVSGESGYASLSLNGGMQGNPAGLSAFESPGAIWSYEQNKNGINGHDNFLFGIWGNSIGASFDWTTAKGGFDKSEWSFVHSEFNVSRSFFLGNRFSATRVSLANGTALSWSPGFILRPSSFLSLGFWSEYALQYGFYQNRMQHTGVSVKMFPGIVASWNARIENYEQLKKFLSKTEQNLLLELDVLGLTIGLEFPLVEPNDNGEFRFAVSTEIGSNFNASLSLVADGLSENMKFKKYSFVSHTALHSQSLNNVRMVRVVLGSISEKSSGWSLWGEQGSDLEMLRNTFSLLEKSETKAVLFDFSNYSGNFSISQEIRRGITSLRSKGKRVAAYTNDYRVSVIFAASAAEKVILQPSALVDFKGVSNEVFYYKGLLDWIGIEMEMQRHGDYKSAIEPYTLDSMSDEAKENSLEVLDSWWKTVRDTLSVSRGLSQEFLDSIASNPRITAIAAKNNRLADTLLYAESIPKYMSKVFFGKENANAYLESWHLSDEKLLQDSWAPRARIAVLNIDGIITGGYGSEDPLFGKSISGVQDLIEQINDIMYSSEFKALILRINSPGGSAIASEELWHSLKSLQESGMPIIASVGDVAASGAYYAAVAADKIIAEAGSIIGSIGIYGGKMNLSGILEKLRINAETVETHESANSASIARGFSESEREALQEYMTDFYTRFTGNVAEGRGISEEKADSLGGGRVFTGMQAAKNGLIDEIGGFGRAIELAKEGAGLRKNARVEIVHINNSGYSFAGRISAMAKGNKPLYPWLKALEGTQVWAIYF